MLCFFHSFVASKARKGRSAKRELRRIGCPRCRQNLHQSGSQNREKLACREHFWKLSFAKFAPRLRARAIWKSNSLKTGGVVAILEVELRKICTTPARKSDFYEKKAPHCMFGALLEVELRKICTTPARESDLEVKIVKAPGARDVLGG